MQEYQEDSFQLSYRHTWLQFDQKAMWHAKEREECAWQATTVNENEPPTHNTLAQQHNIEPFLHWNSLVDTKFGNSIHVYNDIDVTSDIMQDIFPKWLY